MTHPPFRLSDLSTCGGCAAKVPPLELRRMLGGVGRSALAPHVLVGTETGDDAAVVRINDDLALVFTTDFVPPVCDDPRLYGAIAAANAISDVFAMGGAPLSSLAVCAFPEALPADVAHEILAGAEEKAAEAGCPVVGGHTVRNAELLFGLAVTGTIDPGRVVKNQGARVGDALILTKPLGAGVIVNAVRQGKLSLSDARPVFETMATLNRAARDVMVEFEAHAATDVTGFGLAGHALGMARASIASLRIFADALLAYPDALRLQAGGVKTRATGTNREAFETSVKAESGVSEERRLLLFDAQTSGGLLFAVSAERAEGAMAALRERGVPGAARIGDVIEAKGEPSIELVSGSA